MPLSPQIVITPETVTTKNFDITAVAFTSSTATYTATGHTFSVGDIVLVSGIAPDGYNGSFTVTAIATNTFTVSNATNGAVTDGVGNAFWADPTEFEFANYDSAYMTDNNDVNDLIETNTSLNESLSEILAAANQALADAATANANATTAVLQAGVAQTTANGKNKVTYSGSGPSGGGANGDIWFQLDGSNNVAAQYLFNGSSWVSSPITSAVIANLDAAKITSGQITGIAYNNGSGTFSVSPSGVLVATNAFITGAITATSGTFTGTIYAGAGNIGGFSLSGTYFQGTNIRINSDTGIITCAAITASGTIAANAGLTLGGTLSAGGNAFNNVGALGAASITSSGAIVSNGDLSTPNHTTTGNAANGYVFATGGRVTRSTASSLRYKENVTDLRDVPELNPRKLLDFKVRAFSYKDEYLKDDDRAGVLIPGLIAEEVDEIYPLCADYADGHVESINDRAILINLLALIQDQEKRIATLEGK